MNPTSSFSCWYSLDTMHTRFILENTIRSNQIELSCLVHLAKPCRFALHFNHLIIQVLNLQSNFFSKSQIHPEQVIGPNTSFIATSTRADFDNTVSGSLASSRATSAPAQVFFILGG